MGLLIVGQLFAPPRTEGPFCSGSFGPNKGTNREGSKMLKSLMFVPEQYPEHTPCFVRVFGLSPLLGEGRPRTGRTESQNGGRCER